MEGSFSVTGVGVNAIMGLKPLELSYFFIHFGLRSMSFYLIFDKNIV